MERLTGRYQRIGMPQCRMSKGTVSSQSRKRDCKTPPFFIVPKPRKTLNSSFTGAQRLQHISKSDTEYNSSESDSSASHYWIQIRVQSVSSSLLHGDIQSVPCRKSGTSTG